MSIFKKTSIWSVIVMLFIALLAGLIAAIREDINRTEKEIQEGRELVEVVIVAVSVPNTTFDNARTAVRLEGGEVVQVSGVYGRIGDKIKIRRYKM